MSVITYQTCILRNFTLGKQMEQLIRGFTLLMVNTYHFSGSPPWRGSWLTFILCVLILFLPAWWCGNTDIFLDTETVWQLTFGTKLVLCVIKMRTPLYTDKKKINIHLHSYKFMCHDFSAQRLTLLSINIRNFMTCNASCMYKTSLNK